MDYALPLSAATIASVQKNFNFTINKDHRSKKVENKGNRSRFSVLVFLVSA